jgi:DNA-binding Lrp family transcriptional regulator
MGMSERIPPRLALSPPAPQRRSECAAPDERDRVLLEALRHGLPLAPRPYAVIGASIGMGEAEVVQRLQRLLAAGVVTRFGIVVRHHELGYGANAMAVWDVPDARVATLGRRIAGFEFVTLCYRRERSLPAWPYNLYCMIHGRDRALVQAHLATLRQACGLHGFPHAVLFSRRRFKQCGASYAASSSASPRPQSGERAGPAVER